jgi:hypothetical protein
MSGEIQGGSGNSRLIGLKRALEAIVLMIFSILIWSILPCAVPVAHSEHQEMRGAIVFRQPTFSVTYRPLSVGEVLAAVNRQGAPPGGTIFEEFGVNDLLFFELIFENHGSEPFHCHATHFKVVRRGLEIPPFSFLSWRDRGVPPHWVEWFATAFPVEGIQLAAGQQHLAWIAFPWPHGKGKAELSLDPLYLGIETSRVVFPFLVKDCASP